MSKAKSSGNQVNAADVPIINGMIARGDRKHDVAAWHGLNQGRMKEVEDGVHGTPPNAPAEELLPAGSPGPKAQDMRRALDRIDVLLKNNETDAARQIVAEAIKSYNRPV